MPITTIRYNSDLLDAGHNFVVHFNCIENIVLARCSLHALSAVLAGSACGDMEGRFSLQKQHLQWIGWVNSMSGISDSVMPLKSSVACSNILYREKEEHPSVLFWGAVMLASCHASVNSAVVTRQLGGYLFSYHLIGKLSAICKVIRYWSHLACSSSALLYIWGMRQEAHRW